MKKCIAIILLAAALLCLAACSRDQAAAEPTSEPIATPSMDEMALAAASDTDAVASRQSHVSPASSTDLEIDGEAFEKATDCIGLTIFDLYGAIGQPLQSPVYEPSSQQNAQDGTLVYKGFSVTTLRTDTQEIIQDVVLDMDSDPQPTPEVQPADQSMQQIDQNAAG